jgi:hypothetical protein
MSRIRSIVAAVLILSGAMVVEGAAQRRSPGDGPMRGPGAERVEQFKKLRLMEVLDLDEETSIKFFVRYNKHAETVRDIRTKQMKLFREIQSLRRSNAGDGEYGKVLKELLQLESQLNEARQAYINELSGVLTQKQLAEYVVFEVRFQQNLRELLQDVQREREERLKE